MLYVSDLGVFILWICLRALDTTECFGRVLVSSFLDVLSVSWIIRVHVLGVSVLDMSRCPSGGRVSVLDTSPCPGCINVLDVSQFPSVGGVSVLDVSECPGSVTFLDMCDVLAYLATGSLSFLMS